MRGGRGLGPAGAPPALPRPGAALPLRPHPLPAPRPLARGSGAVPGTGGATAGAARPRTHIWYSSIASTSCPQESKSVPFLKLAPQRCRRLRAASDIAPELGHHAHPGPGHPAGQPLPPAPAPRPPPARPSPAEPSPTQPPPRQPNAASASRQRRPAR